ncbi:MAG: hypothetical protein DCC65_13230 [Planctomycetota bacterium]|nr:MAG: hypothetical protein DCC65_13230 [Planctomycetota bacterium]
MADAPTPQAQQSPPPRRISRSRKVASFLLLFAILGGAFFVGLELLFRFVVPVTDVAYMFWDPALGLRRIPNQAGRYMLGGHVNAAYRFNAQGWNHQRDYATARRAGTRRICLVGDSQVESLQVDPDKTMYAVAETLMSRPDRPVEWYAFGCSGWGTAHEYECIRRYVLDYQPDLVVILFLQNDPFDCSPYISALEPHGPRYSLSDADGLEFEYPQYFERSALRRSVSRLAVVRYFWLQKRLVEKIKAALTGEVVKGVGQLPLREGIAAVRAGTRSGAGDLSDDERQRRTWMLIEKLLEATRDACARRGARLAVAFRGWTPEIEAARQGTEFKAPPGEKDPYCLSDRISEMGREWVGPICGRLDIPYLDLTTALIEAEKSSGRLHNFPDDNHYCEIGHAAAGKALADLAEKLLAESPRARVEAAR